MASYRTGNRAHWAPDGFTVRLDTSWDGSGYHVACRDEDVLESTRGNPHALGRLVIRDGAPVLLGNAVFALCGDDAPGNGGLGYSTNRRLTKAEAEAAFVAAGAENLRTGLATSQSAR